MTISSTGYRRAAKAHAATLGQYRDLPSSYADPIAERRENPEKPKVRVKAGSSK